MMGCLGSFSPLLTTDEKTEKKVDTLKKLKKKINKRKKNHNARIQKINNYMSKYTNSLSLLHGVIRKINA
jgi:prefoldin subunit 5